MDGRRDTEDLMTLEMIIKQCDCTVLTLSKHNTFYILTFFRIRDLLDRL